jgi:alpha-mannosidase
MPHAGPLNAGVVREAINFNNPIALHKHPKPELFEKAGKFIQWTGDQSVIIDVVKRGEDDEDVVYPLPGTDSPAFPARKGRSVVVRLYESLGGKSTGNLIFDGLPVKQIYRSNLLEDDISQFMFDKSSIKLTLKAFEVLTVRLQL